MATYIYETIPTSDEQTVKTYEIVQSMHDDALTAHPETGEPIRRVVAGGFGILSGCCSDSEPSGGHCCGGSCGCH
jgi:predicted nucleic acid-binding Zn ribbon protein